MTEYCPGSRGKKLKHKGIFLAVIFFAAWPGGSQVRAVSIEGSGLMELEKEYLEILPQGRATGSVLENWLAPVVFLPVEAGGLSRVDYPRFSFRGISWVEQNWALNGVDITDPFCSGFPLFQPAWDSLRGLQLRSTQESDPYRLGLNWVVEVPDEPERLRLSSSSIFPAGGFSLIPPDVMDREPSFHDGSPEKRRRYRYSQELNGSYRGGSRLYTGVESLLTRREFPTLTEGADARAEEKAERHTLTSIFNHDAGSMPFQLLFLAQYEQNDNYGADRRLDRNQTLDQTSLALHLQSRTGKNLSRGELKIRSGLTARLENRDSHLENPVFTEFDSESGPAPAAGGINRMNLDNRLEWKYSVFNLETGLQLTGVWFEPEIPFSQTGEIYSDYEKSPAFFVTRWDETGRVNEYVLNGRLKGGWRKEWNRVELEAGLFLDAVTAYGGGENLLTWPGAGGKVFSQFAVGRSGTRIGIGFLHQPARLSSQVVGFLDRDRPSGREYIWEDTNENSRIEEPELTLMATTGGSYHQQGTNLKRPYQDELFISVSRKIGENHLVLLQGAHRVFSRYFVVNYGSYDGYYTTVDGCELYHKPLGEDEYVLDNYDGRRSSYSGLELQFLSEWEKFFLNLNASAFLVKGFAPIGNGPDYNDYAVVWEDTASPNSRINAVGRLDSDRAYKLNILLGYKIRKDLSLGSTLKYRDGEPFSQHYIFSLYEDSHLIPVRVIKAPRGETREGGTRYTFAWSLDLRLRYSPVLKGNRFLVVLDIYNLLGSATEMIESNRPEDSRRSLEAVPPRMIRLQVSYLF